MSTGGLWSEDERVQHINALELAGGALAIKTFTKGRGNLHVLLRMDNMTAISLYQPDGRYKIPDPVAGSLQPLALVPSAGDNLVSRAPTGDREHSGRHGVQNPAVGSRIDAGQVHMPQ